MNIDISNMELIVSFKHICKNCGRKYILKDEFDGRELKCKNCKKPMIIKKTLIKGLSKKCPKCNAEMSNKAVVCIKCGFDVRNGQISPVFQEQKRLDVQEGSSRKIYISIASVVFIFICLIYLFVFYIPKQQELSLYKIAKAGSSQDCTEYLKKYSEGKFADEVKILKKEKKAFEKAKIGSSQDCSLYLSKYSDGKYADEIKLLKREKEVYEKAKIGSSQDCTEYLSKFPNGLYVDKVKMLKKQKEEKEEEGLYQNAVNGSSQDCVAYLNKYPNGKKANEIKLLKKQKEEKEEELYKNAKNGTSQDCTTYLRKYPNGKNANEILFLKKLKEIKEQELYIQKIIKQIKNESKFSSKKVSGVKGKIIIVTEYYKEYTKIEIPERLRISKLSELCVVVVRSFRKGKKVGSYSEFGAGRAYEGIVTYDFYDIIEYKYLGCWKCIVQPPKTYEFDTINGLVQYHEVIGDTTGNELLFLNELKIKKK